MQLKQLINFLRRVYSLAAPFGRKRLAFVYAIVLIQGLFQLVGVTSIFPFLALAADPQAFRDSGIGSHMLQFIPDLSNSQLLILAGIFAIFMLLFSNALMLLGEMTRTWYTQNFGNWLRLRLLERILGNPYSYFLQRNTGELLKKMGDVNGYVNGVMSPLMEGSARLITVMFLLVALIFVNPYLAGATTIIFGVFYTTVYMLLRWRRERASDRIKIANRGAMREAMQLLGGIKAVKIHGVEEPFLSRYAHHSMTIASIQKWFPLYNNSPRYLIEPLAFGGIVAIVLFLATKGENLTSLIPTLGVIALAGYRLIPNFQMLYGSFSGISLMMHTMEEVYDEFLQHEGDQPQSTTLRPNVAPLQWSKSIRLNHIRFNYADAAQPVINDLTIDIQRNQFVAFIGQTGSGKSTLIDILLGLHWPQQGQLLVDGKPLTAHNIRNWRRTIGYVPQEIFLRDESIAANIAFGVAEKYIDMNRVRKVAEVAQIRDFVDSELPNGFATEVGERGVRLSGGQRQRIGLARALYHQPSLLVLDEATSALDTATEAALMRAIEDLYGQLTLVVIAHRLSTVRRADKIFVLNKGQLENQGTFDELGLDANSGSHR